MRRQTIMHILTPLVFISVLLVGLLLLSLSSFSVSSTVEAFATAPTCSFSSSQPKTAIIMMIKQQRLHQPSSVSFSSSRSLVALKMMANNKSSSLDPVTYLRTEWVSAALVANQTPRGADRVLQLGVSDGRIVNFVPRTVREIITSSAESKDGPEGGGLTVSAERQLKQMVRERQSIKFAVVVVVVSLRSSYTEFDSFVPQIIKGGTTTNWNIHQIFQSTCR